MNAMHMFRKQFPNGWLVDVQHNPDGFNDRYSTNYPYSVMVQTHKNGKKKDHTTLGWSKPV